MSTPIGRPGTRVLGTECSLWAFEQTSHSASLGAFSVKKRRQTEKTVPFKVSPSSSKSSYSCVSVGGTRENFLWNPEEYEVDIYKGIHRVFPFSGENFVLVSLSSVAPDSVPSCHRNYGQGNWNRRLDPQVWGRSATDNSPGGVRRSRLEREKTPDLYYRRFPPPERTVETRRVSLYTGHREGTPSDTR